MRTLASALGAFALLGPAVPRAAADATSPGYFIESEVPLPLYASFATLPKGGILVFDGQRARVLFPSERLERYLGSTPSFVYPSFVLVHPTQGYALIGESSNGGILEVDFISEDLPQFTQLAFNFDAVWEDAEHLLVSAAPCVLFCGSRIWRLDASTGAQTLVAQVTGPSGPLARAANGDLFYGVQSTSFPPPAGSNRIIRWTSAQVQSGVVLSESNATTVVSGLDGASSIDIDPVYGHLWVANSRFPGGSEVLEFLSNGTPLGQVIASPDWIANLELTRRAASESVEIFPPARGLRIRYAAVDYNPGGNVRLVTVLRNTPPLSRASW